MTSGSTAVAYAEDNQPRYPSTFSDTTHSSQPVRPMPGHAPLIHPDEGAAEAAMRYDFAQAHHRLRRLQHFEVLSFCDPTLLHMLPYESGLAPYPPTAGETFSEGSAPVNPRGEALKRKQKEQQGQPHGKRPKPQMQSAKYDQAEGRPHKKPTRGRFVNKTTYSWISTSTKTMVLLPSATVQLVRQPIALALQDGKESSNSNNNNNNGFPRAAYDMPYYYTNNNGSSVPVQPGLAYAPHGPSRMTVLNDDEDTHNSHSHSLEQPPPPPPEPMVQQGSGANSPQRNYHYHNNDNNGGAASATLPDLTNGYHASSSSSPVPAGQQQEGNVSHAMPPSAAAAHRTQLRPLSESLPAGPFLSTRERPASSPGAQRQVTDAPHDGAPLHAQVSVSQQLPPLRSFGPPSPPGQGQPGKLYTNNIHGNTDTSSAAAAAAGVQPARNGWVGAPAPNKSAQEETMQMLEPGLSIDPAYYAALERSISDSPLQGYVNGVTTMLETGEL